MGKCSELSRYSNLQHGTLVCSSSFLLIVVDEVMNNGSKNALVTLLFSLSLINHNVMSIL